MKNFKTLLVILLIIIGSLGLKLNAQILNVPLVIQEQTNWCWAATSKCVLDYYSFTNAQCTIADYTRTVATWHNFGSVNCCVDPSQGCNYWNYMWGFPGSIEDILIHFGSIYDNEISTYLSIPQIQAEASAGRPFIFRWGWYSGGGHFLVGQGISGTNMYYMNPLPGYGYEISNYNWVVDDGSSHTWTHTLTLCLPAIPGSISGNTSVCQSSSQIYSISPVSGATSYTWTLPSGWTGSSTSNTINTTAGSTGGTISVTANNSCGKSLAQTLAVTVNNPPSQPGNISGNTTVCQNSSQTYSISPVSGASSYTWTLPAGWLGTSTTTSIIASVGSSGGTISVTANNTCGSSTPRTLSVSVNPIPAQPGTISGNTVACQGSSQIYSISPISGATSYTWTLPGGWSGSSTTTTITAIVGSSGGTISVSANNTCGSSPVQTLSVNVDQSVPMQPGAISGNSEVCQGSTQTYSISPVSGSSSYTWVLPSDWSGTSTSNSITSIAGSLSGPISVSANNSCGSSATQTLSVNVNQVPAEPGNITGNTNVCPGSSQVYSINQVLGAISYSWTLPTDWSGFSTFTTINTIIGSISGIVSVTANNTCGSSIAQSLFVTVNYIDTSITINGSTLISNANPAIYQWVKCPTMQLINGETEQTFSPSHDGSYAVILEQNSCVDTSECHTVILTNLMYNDNNISILIYPNPTHDLLTIKCSGIANDDYEFVISDALGQKIKEKESKSINKVLIAQFDLEELSSGIYFLTISSSGLKQVFKVQKQ